MLDRFARITARYAHIICLSVLLLLCSMAEADELRSYTVAIDADYAPYEYLNSNGEVEGFLPDLLRAIGEREGVHFNFIALNWPQAVASLEQGRVDIINMIKTPEREHDYLFSQPHSRITQALFRHRLHSDVTSVDSLQGNLVAIQRNDIAAERYPDAGGNHVVWVDDKQQGFNLLEHGHVAAFFAAEQTGLFLIQNKNLTHVEVVQRGLWEQPYCFAARFSDATLIAQLNHGLAALHASGDYQRIMKHWVVPPASWWQRHGWTVLVLLLSALAVCIVWLWSLRRAVKRRTLALESSKNHFHRLLEALPDAVIMWQNGRAVYANAATFSLLHMHHSKGIQSLDFSRYIDQESDILIHLKMCQAWALREVCLSVSPTVTLEVEITAIMTEHHGQAALQMMMRDISAKKKAQRQQERLLQMLDQTSDYIMLADEHDALVYTNPATQDLFQSPEATAKTLTALHSSSEHDALIHHYLVEAKRKGIYHTDTLLHNQHGAPIPVSAVYIAHCPDEVQARACYISMIARDLRAEITMKSRLEQSQRLESMGKLAGGVAHDFNNIMMAVLGNATLARMRFGEDSPATMYLQRIESSGKRAAELCKQMLAYSGRTHFDMKNMDLSFMVESMQGWVQSTMSSSLLIRYQLSEQPLPIRGDEAQLEQVIMNLLINAGEAIEGRQGKITIKTSIGALNDTEIGAVQGDIHIRAGNFACLTISDDGCGMNEHVANHIFDPFFTTKLSGRGLGMSTVLGVIRGHHGCIRIDSLPDHGTAVMLYFPLQTEEATLPSIKQPSEPLSRDDFQTTVLVVDDEDDVRETAAMMLEVFGYRTISVSGGAEAIEQYRDHGAEISIVLLDMSMPGMDGQTCFQKLREIDPQVRVLISSGHTEIEIGQLFMGQKLLGFIAKPYTPKELQRKLTELGSMSKPVA
jgi:signal transduction histidine kinase/ABC-type amino acid transport substrate-binding protein